MLPYPLKIRGASTPLLPLIVDIIRAKKLLNHHPDLTALVVYNDVRAAGVLRACKEMNYDIPERYQYHQP